VPLGECAFISAVQAVVVVPLYVASCISCNNPACCSGQHPGQQTHVVWSVCCMVSVAELLSGSQTVLVSRLSVVSALLLFIDGRQDTLYCI
jgi:hypothetical protein